jgi:hypothetical protein
MDPDKKTFNCLMCGVVLVAVPMICYLAFSGYRFYLETATRDCYEQLAEEMHISPTMLAIHNEFYEQAQAAVKPGMTRDEVLVALEQIAPVRPAHKDPRLGGGIVEYTLLEICPFPVAEVTFLVYYSEDGIFDHIQLYFDD